MFTPFLPWRHKRHALSLFFVTSFMNSPFKQLLSNEVIGQEFFLSYFYKPQKFSCFVKVSETFLYLNRTRLILFDLSIFSCPPEYVGEYCQHKNPCNTGGLKCQNGGTCNVLMSATRGPTFQVKPYTNESILAFLLVFCLNFDIKPFIV